MPSKLTKGANAMKRWPFLLLILIFLTGCEQHSEGEIPNLNYEGEICSWEQELEETDGKMLTIQENLARWYNYQLQNGGDCAGAYDSILYYSNGILGMVEVPSCELRLPIYHGVDSAAVGHDPTTPFPIGETGNHTVLVTGLPLNLNPGDTFLVHILGQTLTYQVVAVRQKPDTTAVPGMDYCSILAGEECQILGIRCQEDDSQNTEGTLPG